MHTLSSAPLTTSARATISQRLVNVLTVEDVGGEAESDAASK
jgi:hypothetical protein